MASNDEKTYLDTDTKKEPIVSAEDISDDPHQQEQKQEHGLHESDAALANAPWRYKLIALATALMLPGTSLTSFTIMDHC